MNADEHKMLTEVHDFLFKSRKGKPSRADTLDSMIFGLRAGRLGYRTLLLAAAFVAAVGTAWGSLKGWKLW